MMLTAFEIARARQELTEANATNSFNDSIWSSGLWAHDWAKRLLDHIEQGSPDGQQVLQDSVAPPAPAHESNHHEGQEGGSVAHAQDRAHRLHLVQAHAKVVTIKDRNDAILSALREQTKENITSPEKARAALVASGIYTKEGELAPPTKEPTHD